MTEEELSKRTGGWVPHFPRAYEKSVVLGGGKVLFPVADPEKTAAVLRDYVTQAVTRAFIAGKAAGKEEIRNALFEL